MMFYKKSILSKLILIIGLLLISFVLFANDETLKVIKNGNLRSGPSTKYNIIGNLEVGIQVSKIEKSDGWYKVKLPNEKVGWAYQSLLSPIETKESNDVQDLNKKKNLNEINDFKVAKADSNLISIGNYLINYPEGTFVAEAESLLEARLDNIRKINNYIQGLEFFEENAYNYLSKMSQNTAPSGAMFVMAMVSIETVRDDSKNYNLSIAQKSEKLYSILKPIQEENNKILRSGNFSAINSYNRKYYAIKSEVLALLESIKELIETQKSEYQKEVIELEEFNKIKAAIVNAQASKKLLGGIKAIISEYHVNWEKLANEILKSYGGINKFTLNSSNKFEYLSPKDREMILNKVPDFEDKITSLFYDWKFSDSLFISRKIVNDFSIEYYGYKAIDGFEFKEDNILRKVNFNQIKEIRVYSPCFFKFRTGKSTGYSINIAKKYYSNIDFNTATGRDIPPIAEVILIDGTSSNMQLSTADRKIKWQSDFQEFEIDLFRAWKWLEGGIKIVFEHKSKISNK